jgi:hypothetical protein
LASSTTPFNEAPSLIYSSAAPQIHNGFNPNPQRRIKLDMVSGFDGFQKKARALFYRTQERDEKFLCPHQEKIPKKLSKQNLSPPAERPKR